MEEDCKVSTDNILSMSALQETTILDTVCSGTWILIAPIRFINYQQATHRFNNSSYIACENFHQLVVHFIIVGCTVSGSFVDS